jgi:hypothetical protein
MRICFFCNPTCRGITIHSLLVVADVLSRLTNRYIARNETHFCSYVHGITRCVGVSRVELRVCVSSLHPTARQSWCNLVIAHKMATRTLRPSCFSIKIYLLPLISLKSKPSPLDVFNRLVTCWLVSSSFPEFYQHSCYLLLMFVNIVHWPTHDAGINIHDVVRSRGRFLFSVIWDGTR